MSAPDEEDLTAAEYVLGLLDPPEAAKAESRLAANAAFAARVEHWRSRFAELDFTAPAGSPPRDLLARISATLDADAAPQGESRAPAGPARAGDTPIPPTRRAAPRRAWAAAALWHNLGFWRGTGLAGAAASVLLLLGLAFGPLGQPSQPQFVAVLMGPQGEPAAVVNAFSDGTADLIPLRGIEVPDGRVLEVWTLWDPARGPVSIGLAGEARRIRLDLKTLPRTGPNQLFEMTLEPRGGSPTGRPTGPILMKGTTSLAL